MPKLLKRFPWRLVRKSYLVKLKYDSWQVGHDQGWFLRENLEEIVTDMHDGKTSVIFSKNSVTTITPDGQCVVEDKNYGSNTV